jgi:hypothetical protein
LVVACAGDGPADGRHAVAAFELAAVHREDRHDAARALVDAFGDPLGRDAVAFAMVDAAEARASRLGHQYFTFSPA